MNGSDMSDDFLADWERELLGGSKPKIPKPTAKPAFDPFQEVEVKDSRHMFKIDPKKTRAKTQPELMSWSDRLMKRKMGLVHLRVGNKLGCGEAMPLFMWTWQQQEATCTGCQRYEARTRELKDRIDNLEDTRGKPIYIGKTRQGEKVEW